jgi:hypothetical protein
MTQMSVHTPQIRTESTPKRCRRTLHLRFEQPRVPALADQQDILLGQVRTQLVNQLGFPAAADAVLRDHSELRVVDLVGVGGEQHPLPRGKGRFHLRLNRGQDSEAPVAGQVTLPKEPILHIHDDKQLRHHSPL